ncbi:hypothetical protein PHYC_00610 [Phycisphaerales bacterium]|nr:hypothetical protein PHYC_00610 [Phycisphaerales bacterium]
MGNLRWTCTISLAVVLAAYAFTARYTAFVGWGNDDNRSVQLASGCISARWELGGPLGQRRSQLHVRKHPFYWRFQLARLPWRPNGHQLVIPLWCPTVLLALPTALLWRSHRQNRATLNPCPKCGYSLTGLAVGAPCPEMWQARAG